MLHLKLISLQRMLVIVKSSHLFLQCGKYLYNGITLKRNCLLYCFQVCDFLQKKIHILEIWILIVCKTNPYTNFCIIKLYRRANEFTYNRLQPLVVLMNPNHFNCFYVNIVLVVNESVFFCMTATGTGQYRMEWNLIKVAMDLLKLTLAKKNRN